MAGLKGREFAKKDMNFFSEFTQSSQAFARASGWIIIGAIAAIAITVLVCIWRVITLGVLTAGIKVYDDKFNTDEYKNLSVQAQQLAEENARISEYNYVMQTMKTNAKKDTGVQFNIISNIESNIPSDTIVKDYDVDKGTVRIVGYSFNYYSPTEMLMLIKDELVLTNENLKITRIDPSDLGTSEEMATNFINAYYLWEFTGSLQTDSAITISYVGPDSLLLKNLETEWIKTGDTYELGDVRQITYAGKTYNLDSIFINGTAITADELDKVKASGNYDIFIEEDTKIDVYYVEFVANTSTTEGAA